MNNVLVITVLVITNQSLSIVCGGSNGINTWLVNMNGSAATAVYHWFPSNCGFL